MVNSMFNFPMNFVLASYACIAKLKSATGGTSNVPATTPAPVPPPPPPQQQQPAPPRSSTTGKTTAPTRTNNPPPQQQQQQQPSRGNGNFFPSNNRANHWNDNQQQDQFSGRRPGANLVGVPDEQQVFVGSLPLEFSREDLIDCFKQFGNVIDAKIRTPPYDNKKVRPFNSIHSAFSLCS